LELARVGACEVDALCDTVAFAHGVLDGELKVRESLDESGKEPRPCLMARSSCADSWPAIGHIFARSGV
jgi:hypothetical protein